MKGGLRYVRDEPHPGRADRRRDRPRRSSACRCRPSCRCSRSRSSAQGVDTYSRMMSFSGAGAVIGALAVAWLGRFDGMGKVLLGLQAVFSLLMIAVAWSRSMPLTYLLLFAGRRRRRSSRSALVTSLVQLVAPDAHARPGDEHLHGGLPRRHAARQPGERRAGVAHRAARRADPQRRAAVPGRRLLPDAGNEGVVRV